MRIERIDVHVVKTDRHYRLRGVEETPGLVPGTDYFIEPHWRQAHGRRLEACFVRTSCGSREQTHDGRDVVINLR